jgi:glycosyltransferase involved in cell wall biosynthesis
VVEHGKAGLLCPAGDTAAIAESLLTLLRDPALRRRMGEYGRTQVVTRFAPDRLAGDAERLYRALSQQ